MLPILSGKEIVKIFESLGWEVSRRRGSHIIMTKQGGTVTMSVPNHRGVARELCEV